MSVPRTLLVSSALALLLAGEAQAGVTVNLVNAGREETLEFEGKNLRMEEEGTPRVLVFDGEGSRYLEIDTSERTWAMATRDDVIAAGRAADADLRQHLSSADPEEVRAWIEWRNRARKRIEAMKRTRFEPGSGQAMVAEHMCDGFDEVIAGEVVAWGCYVVWGRTTFQKEEFSALTRFAEFLNAGLGHVEAAQGLDLRDGPLGRLARAPGVPLFRLDLREGGKLGVPFKVTRIARERIPPERFAPPPDYRQLPQPASLSVPVKAALPAGAPDSPARAVPPGR